MNAKSYALKLMESHPGKTLQMSVAKFIELIDLAIADEREACATLLDGAAKSGNFDLMQLANQIRNRS